MTKQEQLNRAKTLLKATYDLLQQQDDAYFVLNLLAQSVEYDGTSCDGYCLKDDIQSLLEEMNLDI